VCTLSGETPTCTQMLASARGCRVGIGRVRGRARALARGGRARRRVGVGVAGGQLATTASARHHQRPPHAGSNPRRKRASPDHALLRLTGGLRVDPLADLAALVLLGALLVALLLDPGGPRRGPHVALYCLITAALLLVVHAGALLPLVAGLEIAALGLGALLAVDPRSRRAAWSWLFGQAIISGLLLFGVALLFGATGTTDLSELGGRVSAVFTRWGASPAQAAVDLLQSGVSIPPQLAEQARTRAVTAMAPAALFIPACSSPSRACSRVERAILVLQAQVDEALDLDAEVDGGEHERLEGAEVGGPLAGAGVPARAQGEA
jgi:hypothetical protein